MVEIKKRNTAYKVRIGDLLRGEMVFEELPKENLDKSINPRLLHVGLGDKQIYRVNLVANVIEKYQSEGESKFASITLDDGSGQIRVRVFGEDVSKFNDIVQGDTLVVIGYLRSFNQELYVIPEIIKKRDPKYLLVRKLEIEKMYPKVETPKEKKEIKAFRDEIIEMIKASEEYEGIEKEEIINKIKNTNPETINQEIQKLIEDGIVYEPRPGRVRYLG